MSTTRFAPSPTGQLHLGHAYSAVLGERAARQSGGGFLLRIEDLDQTRSRPEFIAGIEEGLRWLGLEWDAPQLIQSERSTHYEAALADLREQGLIYACFCTRSDIAAALNAPHEQGSRYPGTCRGKEVNPDRLASEPHSWRLDARRAIERVGPSSWTEHDGTVFTASASDINDEILARKDAPAAYHLACVVDDAASGVDLVVRGADLRSSTPVQRLLQMLLRLPQPLYFHHPLVVTADGRRLAKRDRAPTLQALRERGVNGRELADQLATGRIPSGFRLGPA